MRTDLLDYNLPESLIAQSPSERRDASRLMVVDRASGDIRLDIYQNLPLYLERGDCMALNDTRVIRARLHGKKVTGGHVEVFLLHETAPGYWTALVRPSAKVKPGTRVIFSPELEASIEEATAEGRRGVRFNRENVMELLEDTGAVPLPPYIKRASPGDNDAERYQTVYAKSPGAVAAPTAGLHLTDAVFKELDKRGVLKTFLTLHVGYGTFKPITAERLEDHVVDPEEFVLSDDTAATLDETRSRGNRILAVGTTCARVLESRYSQNGFLSGKGITDLYIHPPYVFKAIDMLQTNFHLPHSSLLALVCAFAGRDLTMAAYHRAIEEKFRFYSYGDVMLIK